MRGARLRFLRKLRRTMETLYPRVDDRVRMAGRLIEEMKRRPETVRTVTGLSADEVIGVYEELVRSWRT